ncbi:uncharacterized protein FIBRA_00373 [Fibroporia radiculosa]|uniref:Uncharacterized protein n=1 Tax=Fibroporia radiculosa TaxID=599839 RepID=J4G052_9APHY|nr:uncharacterized protein FIBRA_00373 [Fibroporia radiculosa]CCL98378.1 predicted protein [Fibroporia radiculosa]
MSNSMYKDNSLASVSSLKEKDGEKVAVDTLPVLKEEGNIGLNEFEAAKDAGVRVSSKDNTRYAGLLYDPEGQDQRAVCRIALKIDRWILPMGLSYLDKTALNYGNLYGMRTDLDVTGQQFDWFASAFYFGYLIGNYPQGWLLQHYHAGRVLATTTALWGIIVLCIPAAHNFGGILAAYFFLGIIESIVTPGLTLLTAIWYAQAEVPLRTMIWYSFNGWAGIFGGFLAYGIGKIENPSIARWKYIFLILGAISFAYALMLWILFPDSPVGARFLKDEDKVLAVKRVAEAKTGIKNTEFKAYQIKEALVDPKTWLLFIASISAQIPNGIVSNFSSIVIEGMGFTTLQTTLLDAAASGVQIASLIAAGVITTYVKNTRVITMAAGNITCIISAACLTYLPADQKWNRLIAYWFTNFQSVGFSLSLVMISNNVGGFTKKTFITALTFIGYCIGNIIGPHFLIASEAPTYHTGTRAMFVGYCIKTAALLLLGLYMWRSNVKKDRMYGKVETYEDELKGEEADFRRALDALPSVATPNSTVCGSSNGPRTPQDFLRDPPSIRVYTSFAASTPCIVAPRVPAHSRHRLGVASLALDTSTQLVGRSSPEGILYTGGRDGLVISWDLGIPMKRRAHRYGVTEDSRSVSTRGWEIMTNWADDVIEEETDDGEDLRSDGDVLGEVTGRHKRKVVGVQSAIPEEEQWETDVETLEARKTTPPSTQFRQCAQMHSDWVNDILLCNQNQTLITASSDGTVRAWNPHAHENTVPLQDPVTIGTHGDYVRCLAHSRDRHWVASGSFDRTIKLWDLGAASSNTPVATLTAPEASGPKGSIYALAMDSCGTMIASGSPERVVRLWDPRSNKRIGKLVGHTDNIRAMLLSEDARYLLTGSADASIKLWSLYSQRCLHTFTHHTDSVWSLFSQHPTLENFFSGDRSGFVCKVDVEGCADVSEGECIVLCQDTSERGNGSSAAEGVNRMVAMDDSVIWTASGSSSFKRWKVPVRRSVRAATSVKDTAPSSECEIATPPLGDGSGEANTQRPVIGSSADFTSTPTRSSSVHISLRAGSPPRIKTHRESLSPSLHSSISHAQPECDPFTDAEGNETWYGIPFESLVRLTSPNESFSGFGGHGSMFRGHDPEIATLYSAASVMSIPRLVRPVQSMLGGPIAAQGPRSPSPFRAGMDDGHSHVRMAEETQTLHPGTRARAAFEEREVAADAVPLRHEPDEIVQGEHGLVRSAMLNDRIHALTVDTAGEVAVWDVVRGVCRGRFMSEDVAAASSRGSEASVILDGESARSRKERSPREALEAVRERIEGEAVVQPWATVDTKTGVLTVHLSERCFEAEIYADEAGYSAERRYGDETRLNIGKWVLRNLFSGFIREEQRALARRTREAEIVHRMHRGGAPNHIDLNGHPPDLVRPSVDPAHSPATRSPRSTNLIYSPNIVPAVSPSTSPMPRTPVPLLTPQVHRGTGIRESALSPIPQSPVDSAPISQSIPRTLAIDTSTTSSPSQTSDYFTSRARRGSVSTGGTSDEWGGKDPALQTPGTPTAGGLMGRIKAFGKGTKRQASEPGTTPTGGTLAGGDTMATPGDLSAHVGTKSPAQALLNGPINPPSTTDAPALQIPPHTSLVISEEAASGWTTLYRGQVANTGGDMRILEELLPYWLLEYLLANRVPPVPVTKISFVLLPYPSRDSHGEQLPELLNTAQSKLTASRFLRVRKLTIHVQDKLDKLTGSRGPTSPNTPRSSFDSRSMSSAGRGREPEVRPRAEDLYEIVCNDVVLPLDMTLAAVRQFVWRQSAELSMYYRRKASHSRQ